MFFAKKRILLFSFVGLLCFIFIFGTAMYFNMSAGAECSFYDSPVVNCTTALIFLALFFSVPVFILSVLFYHINDKTFISWKRFTFIYLLAYLFIVIIAPWRVDEFLPLEKKMSAFIAVCIYVITSLLLIAIKSWKLRKQQPQI